MPTMTERPWMFTMLFFIWTLDTVLRLREGSDTWLIWLLPFVFALWANLHIQFIYGLFVLGLACVTPAIDRLHGLGDDAAHARKLGSPSWRRLVALTVLCAAATLLNPYHVALYGVIVEYATQSAPFQFIDELTAPKFRLMPDFAGLGLFGAAAYALGRWRNVSSFEILLLAATAVFAFRAQRDFWFVTVTSVVFLAMVFPAPAPRAPLPSELAALMLVGVAGVVLFAWSYFTRDWRLKEFMDQTYPVQAVQTMKEKKFPGPLFNPFDWGGYLIWHLPELPVSVDGRTNLYGNDRIIQAFDTTSGRPNWKRDPDLNSANVLLVGKGSPLADLIREDRRFNVVFEDRNTMVLVRANQAPAPSKTAAPPG